MQDVKDIRGLVWGLALLAMGIGVFLAAPHKMAELEKVTQSSLLYFGRFCIYLLSIILVGGGVKKIIDGLNRSQNSGPQE